ncbi:hypothetical protein [Streptomyces gardneri]|uniref:DUF2867 domain-containing protein n=1 Tax=Streptomyces gardneri TaxID=66892 RepID=A0A4Y3RLQ5_9ACTN|nr:hypothetical protein [Streptomyces gardneri]GEB58575.1 hypothetical protein SGA01_41800 [Streptomyces gardneri]GHH06327.1 hypothetical protein GCM10017674_46510 [Streptomyces gardneri]
MDTLPYVDEHAVIVGGGGDEAWSRVRDGVERALSRRWLAGYARVVRAEPREAGGPRPLAEGAVFPGFRVVRVVPGRELALEGRHRFSVYSLVFRIEELSDGRTRLRAESRAAFPGVAGWVYRALVIGSGGHAAGMRRMLASFARG